MIRKTQSIDTEVEESGLEVGLVRECVMAEARAQS